MKAVRNKTPMSKTRRNYIIRLVGRCVILVLCVLYFIFVPDAKDVLYGMNFFRELSPLHILWLVWCIDMLLQVFPIKSSMPLGSQKLFRTRFRPITEKINVQALKRYTKTTALAAYKVFFIWVALVLLLGLLYKLDIISGSVLFLISVVFYVCDLICVLIWCPFRLLMKTRCCTTCRIFNWDHLMMFSPLVFIPGFFTLSLAAFSFLVFLLWELFVLVFPERFWENSNEALKCSECTDKLCTQYCRKLRKE